MPLQRATRVATRRHAACRYTCPSPVGRRSDQLQKDVNVCTRCVARRVLGSRCCLRRL